MILFFLLLLVDVSWSLTHGLDHDPAIWLLLLVLYLINDIFLVYMQWLLLLSMLRD